MRTKCTDTILHIIKNVYKINFVTVLLNERCKKCFFPVWNVSSLYDTKGVFSSLERGINTYDVDDVAYSIIGN